MKFLQFYFRALKKLLSNFICSKKYTNIYMHI